MPKTPRSGPKNHLRRRDPETGWVQLDWGTASKEMMDRAEAWAETFGKGYDDLVSNATLYFVGGEEEGIDPAALVHTALQHFPVEARRRQDQANIEADAVDVFGEPEGPDRMTDYSHAGPVPAWVYDSLPGPLGRLCRFYDAGPQRDTFLVGALGAIAAALPELSFRYSHVSSRCNLFLCVVAPSGAGKGSLAAAGRLLRPIDDYLLEVSDREIDRWERVQRAKEQAGGMFEPTEEVSRERPPYRHVTFGGDSSDAAFFLAAHANGGHGTIFETEIATLLTSMAKDWSNFRAKLLNGWANEKTQYDRKERRPLFLYDPEISLVTSGTPRAFAEWIRDNEDGLFNRTGFYTFDAAPGWVSGWAENDLAAEMDDAHRDVSGVLLRAYKQLTTCRADPDDERERRRVPLKLVFAQDQQQRLDATFEAQKLNLPELGLAPLANYTHRLALVACRIAGALSVFRLACDRTDLSLPLARVPVTEPDFRVGLQMGALLMAHGVELARQHFRGVDSPVRKAGDPASGTPRRAFLDEIGRTFGDAPFRRGDAIPDVIERIGLKSRKGDAYLGELVREGFLERVGAAQGLYQRTDKAPSPTLVVERQKAAPPVPVGFVPNHLLFPPGNDGAAPDSYEEPPVLPPADEVPSSDAPPSGDAPF